MPLTPAQPNRSTLRLGEEAGGPAVQLCGEDAGTLRSLAAAAGEQLGLAVLGVSTSALPPARAELAALARRCSRDLALSEAILLLEAHEASPEAAAAAAQFEHMPARMRHYLAPQLHHLPLRTGAFDQARYSVTFPPACHSPVSPWRGR